jgi:hypothetical protein
MSIVGHACGINLNVPNVAGVLKRGEFDVCAHIVVTDEVRVVAETVFVGVVVDVVGDEFVSVDVALVPVPAASVPLAAAYVNEYPATVYVPVFDPSAGNFKTRKSLLPDLLVDPTKFIAPAASIVILRPYSCKNVDVYEDKYLCHCNVPEESYFTTITS